MHIIVTICLINCKRYLNGNIVNWKHVVVHIKAIETHFKQGVPQPVILLMALKVDLTLVTQVDLALYPENHYFLKL